MDVYLPKLYVKQSGSLRGLGAASDDNAVIAKAISDIQTALVKIANNRQETVTATIVQRRSGLVLERRFYDAFDNARGLLLEAARALDEQLDVIERADPATWNKIVGDFNKYVSRLPGVNLSSPSVAELIALAVPPIPLALMAPVESAASVAAVNAELARYETRQGAGLNGLGFFQSLVGAATGSACLTAAAAAGVVTAGAGAVVVGVGCLLAGIATTLAVSYVIYSLVKRLPTAAATSIAAADSLEGALAQVSDACKKNNLSPDQCSALAQQAAANTKPPKSVIDVPWGLIAVAAGGVALWYFWPVLVGKARAARASQVAGLSSRRRRRAR